MKIYQRVIVHKFTMDTIQKDFFILYKSMWGCLTEDVHDMKQTIKKKQLSVKCKGQQSMGY